MATLDSDSSFQKWVLTERELHIGSQLTTLQKQCIQNQITQFAEERIALLYDPQNPMSFVQRDAELKGQINALKYLFQLSDAADQALNSPQPQE